MKTLSSLILMSLLVTTSVWAKLPYVPIEFPRADAAHFEDSTTLTEWWYFNGKLTSTNGRKFAYYIIYSYFQTKIFGSVIKAPCFVLQITDLDNKKVYGQKNLLLPIQRLDKNNLDIMFGKNITLQNVDGTYLIEALATTKSKDRLRVSLQLTPSRSVLLNGENGYRDGWGDSSMYYYSQPHLLTAGSIEVGSEQFNINPQTSLSWMNRQWTDCAMRDKSTQWQWANAQLDNGIDLDLWQIYNPKTQAYSDHAINILLPDGRKFYSENITYTARDHPSDKYPQVYDLFVPEINLRLTFTASAPNQDVAGFWEGMSDVAGIYNSVSVRGHGYTENTLR